MHAIALTMYAKSCAHTNSCLSKSQLGSQNGELLRNYLLGFGVNEIGKHRKLATDWRKHGRNLVYLHDQFASFNG